MGDYAEAGHRKTKRDKKAKARYKPYKKGGKYRSKNVEEGKKK